MAGLGQLALEPGLDWGIFPSFRALGCIDWIGYREKKLDVWRFSAIIGHGCTWFVIVAGGVEWDHLM